MTRYRELADTWLQSAFGDMRLAELGAQEGLDAQVCFMCQQAAEKALKAYLFAQQQSPPRTHVLPRLLQVCSDLDAEFRDLTEACIVLTSYYTDTRYPDAPTALDEYDEALAGQAIILARQVVAFVDARLRRQAGQDVGKGEHT